MSETSTPPASSESEAWENAYLAQLHDAATGRLFRGVIHNLNGVLQVTTLHGEFSGLLLTQAEQLLERLRGAAPDQFEVLLSELAALLAGHRDSVSQLQEKTGQGSELLRRVLLLPPLAPGPAPVPPCWTISNVLTCEIEFMCADPFFKHKVEKVLALAESPPPLSGDLVSAHQIVHLLLANALEAVRGREGARITVGTSCSADGIELLLGDNGDGIAAADRERIFLPFFANRQGRQGLGLYLAHKLARQLGGELVCLAAESGGAFKLQLPSA